jgi:membrane protease YdiL (CAAX protease family)
MNDSPPASRAWATADLIAVTSAIIFPTFVTYIYFTLLATAATIVQYAAYGFLKTTQFGMPVIWVRLVRGHKISFHSGACRGMVPAVGFGILVVAAMWCLYKYWLLPTGGMDAALGPIREKIEGFGLNTPWSYAGLAVFYALIHSGLEEYYWRWFVFGQLRRYSGISLAIIVSSFGFAAHHVLLLATFFGWTSPLTWIFSLGIAMGGAVWAWLYQRSGSLYSVWCSHMLVDAGIFLIGFDLVGVQ